MLLFYRSNVGNVFCTILRTNFALREWDYIIAVFYRLLDRVLVLRCVIAPHCFYQRIRQIILLSSAKQHIVVLISDACARDFLKDAAQNIAEACFDDLDVLPVVVGARNWITPPFEFDPYFLFNPFFPDQNEIQRSPLCFRSGDRCVFLVRRTAKRGEDYMIFSSSIWRAVSAELRTAARLIPLRRPS